MRRTTFIFGLLLLFVPTLLTAGTGPRIKFEATEHDFGDVIHGQSPSVELTCANTGDDLLILERIESSCGCAKAVRGSRRVAPGSSTKIFAQIETQGMSPGRHFKTLAVHSNDPDRPRTSLKLLFNVVRHVSISPEVLAMCLLQAEKDAAFCLKATNHWTHPITLRAGKADGSTEVELLPQEVVLPPGGKVDFQLLVRVKSEPGQSYLKGTAVIETDDALEKVLPVRYFIQLPKTGCK